MLWDGGLALEGRIVKLGLVSIVIDDKPDRQALSFTFDGPAFWDFVLRAQGSTTATFPVPRVCFPT